MFTPTDMSSAAVITGHRGFKAKYTENTIHGFKKCYGTGATVIETDLWLTKDNVLVISHDISTKRIFCDKDGNETDYNILETNYEDLKDLQTIESGERLLTFPDVLNWFYDYVTKHNSDDHKLMLDIKRYNPTKLLKYLIKDLLSVHDDLGWWLHRLQFGVWDLSFVKYLNQDTFFQKHFRDLHNKLGYQQFDVFHISVDWRDSVHYLAYNAYLDSLPDEDIKFKVTGVSLLYISTWSIGFLTKFVPLLKIQDLKLYSWTINNNLQFDYLLNLGRIADLKEFGIITDHPDLMADRMNGKLALNGGAASFSDDELVTELTRLTTNSDPYNYDLKDISYKQTHFYTDYYKDILTFKQRFAYFVFKTFNQVAGSKRVSDEELVFDSFVDENKISPVKVNGLASWIFATCQKYGIF